MPKTIIDDVWLDEGSCSKNGMGMTLVVYLKNGSTIGLLLDSKANEPLFSDVVMSWCGKPKTDGECVYWENGASLTLDEMINMLHAGA